MNDEDDECDECDECDEGDEGDEGDDDDDDDDDDECDEDDGYDGSDRRKLLRRFVRLECRDVVWFDGAGRSAQMVGRETLHRRKKILLGKLFLHLYGLLSESYHWPQHFKFVVNGFTTIQFYWSSK